MSKEERLTKLKRGLFKLGLFMGFVARCAKVAYAEKVNRGLDVSAAPSCLG